MYENTLVTVPTSALLIIPAYRQGTVMIKFASITMVTSSLMKEQQALSGSLCEARSR